MKTGHLVHDFSSAVINTKLFSNRLINFYFMSMGDCSVYFSCFSRSFLAESLIGLNPFYPE